MCGSKKANRKAKIEKAVLIVCNECVKLGEEIPVFVKNKKEKKEENVKKKEKGKATIGDVIEVR